MSPRGQSVPGYEYRDLGSPDELRILVLIPSDSLDAPLTCEIELRQNGAPNQSSATSQAQSYNYDALSWCWPLEEEKTTKWIKITEHSSPVTSNMEIPLELHLALVNLRYKDKKRYLWIDYICINQKNTDERSTQVPRMSTIYGDAENVCVWLGDNKDNSDRAIDFINEIAGKIYRFEEKLTDDHIDSWKAIKNLMKRRWFHRRWVIQEVALAKVAVIHCGTKQLLWDKFAVAISLLVEDDGRRAAEQLREMARKDDAIRNMPAFFDEIPALGATTLVKATTRIQEKIDDPRRSVSLPYLVGTLAIFKNKEPRDTIYALLALARDVQPYASRLPATAPSKVQRNIALQLIRSYDRRYPVNYKTPILEVYQQFIAYSIAHAADPVRALDVVLQPFAQSFTDLQDANSNPDDPLMTTGKRVKIPSWMRSESEVTHSQSQLPGQQFSGSPYEMVRRCGDQFISQPGVGRYDYNAAGTKRYDPVKLRFRKRRGHYSMYVEGFILDEITEVFEASQHGAIPGGWFEVFDAGPESNQDPDTLWRTLCANRSPSGPPPYHFKWSIHEGIQNHPRKQDFNTEQLINMTQSGTWSQTFRHISDTIWGRRLIRTREGHIGLASNEASAGDLVCILYGCSVPVVLKKFEKSPQQVKSEDDEDVAYYDSQIPFIEPLVKRFLERWRIKHQKDPANIFLRLIARLSRRPAQIWHPDAALPSSRIDKDNVGESRPVTVTSASVSIVSQSPRAVVQPFFWRIIALMSVVAYATHQLGQTLLARLLVLMVIPQVLIDFNRISAHFVIPSPSMVWLKASATRITTSSVGILLVAAALNYGNDTPAMEIGSIAVFVLLVFPELLPPRILDAIERYIKSQSSPVIKEARKRIAKSRAKSDKEKQAMKLQWFQVIGECYIDKMMNGQAIKMQNLMPEKLKAIMIELR
ncbi:hypothetical protein AMS68_000769 [Peltaster fructicola]|uniref:Heterokaryon incompatibility domain-containing protein n=1 Tax=Peltaster fructicola TaxID=286661 RepID=A0A6H0XKJ3_9PEZI|nr:hypothetical protein AMS68_000769 [Peltaster fructicola]